MVALDALEEGVPPRLIRMRAFHPLRDRHGNLRLLSSRKWLHRYGIRTRNPNTI